MSNDPFTSHWGPAPPVERDGLVAHESFVPTTARKQHHCGFVRNHARSWPSPGTIFRGSRLALLPKGRRRHGFGISADREHGSVLGRELLRIGGEIVDAPVVSWREALRLVDDDYATVLARFARSRS